MSKYTINTTTDVVEDKDVLGGGSYLMESDSYLCTIKHAFIKQAKSGAIALSIAVANEDGKELKEDLYFVSGNAKGNKTFYVKDGKNYPLPSYTVANAICMLTVGKSIDELLEQTEVKVVKMYSPATSKEEPTEVDAIMALKDQVIKLGVLKETVDKTQLNEGSGKYEPTGETRDTNKIGHVFRASDSKTMTELKNNADASFENMWVEKNRNVTRNLATSTTNNNNNNSTENSGTKEFSFN